MEHASPIVEPLPVEPAVVPELVKRFESVEAYFKASKPTQLSDRRGEPLFERDASQKRKDPIKAKYGCSHPIKWLHGGYILSKNGGELPRTTSKNPAVQRTAGCVKAKMTPTGRRQQPKTRGFIQMTALVAT